MKQLLLAITLFIGASSFSQGMGDVTIFSNTGDQFYVVLNGIRQNNAPETNVKVTGLNNSWYSCKIISANNNFTIDKKIIVKYDTLITYEIRNKKDKYKLRFMSETPTGTATAQSDQAIITYHATETTEPVNTTTGTTSVNTSNANIDNSSSTTVTTTTNTTSSTNGMGSSTTVNDGNTGTAESVNINMNVSETGMNVDIKTTGTEGGNASTTTSTDVNSSTSTTTTSSGDGTYYEESSTTTTTSSDGTYYEETTTTTVTTTTSGDKVLYEDNEMTATIEPIDCSFSDEDTDELIKQIEAEAFSDDQQRVANMAAERKCMSTAQIKKVAKSFVFAENQLDFMKAAYDNCIDKDNYYQLMDVLTFSGDKAELEKFINTK